MTMISKDRRIQPRAELRSEVVVLFGNERVSARALNVSQTGMGLLSPVSAQVGLMVRTLVTLPVAGGWIAADAILVREERRVDGFAWGLRFQATEPALIRFIESYLKSRQIVEQPASRRPVAAGRCGKTERDHELDPLYRAALRSIK